MQKIDSNTIFCPKKIYRYLTCVLLKKQQLLFANKAGGVPKLALHDFCLGGDAAFDSVGGFIWADGKRFSLADNSLEVYAEDTVSGR